LRKRSLRVEADRQKSPDRFTKQQNELVTEIAWGTLWSRPGLPLKIKSLAVLGITAAINRPQEFRVHMNGALNNGCTPEEIREVLLLVALYCGIPAANEAHRIAYETIKERLAGKA